MLRLLTYKVVNDANDALNVFAEMLSIKLALQSLKENRKKKVYRKSSIKPPGGFFISHLRGDLIETGGLFEKGAGAYLI